MKPGSTSRLLLWNLGSFFVLAVSGFLANMVIARLYGPAITGLFNQVFALYAALSQVAAFGIHLSALHESSLIAHEGTPDGSRRLGGAVVAVMLTATVMGVAGWVLSFGIGNLFRNPALPEAWRLALPGLWCFALNKVLIAIANGQGRVRFYATAQALRPVLFLAGCIIWGALGLPGETLALVLSLAEGTQLAFMAVVLVLRGGLAMPRQHDIRFHAVFGIKALPAALFADLNGRLDVLVLGLFVSDTQVGVYTVAAWFVQGAQQLSVAIRPLMNRSMAQIAASRDGAAMTALHRKFGGLSMLMTVTVLVVIGAGYHFFAEFVLRQPEFAGGRTPFLILSAGLALASYWLPFDMFLVQAGRPSAHSVMKGSLCAINLVLGLLLVPLYGMIGAAIAYGFTFMAYAAWLRWQVAGLFAPRRGTGPA